MAQIEEFMFQNVAYRPTVYRTGYLFHFFLDRQDDLEDEEDNVIVTADPIRGQHVTVKRAIISTTNPHCTSAIT